MNHQEEISRLAEEIEAMKERHSVRQYEDRPLDQSAVAALQEEISACNREGELHIQLVMNEPKAFDGFMAHYGKFSGVRNYIAMIGKIRQDERRSAQIKISRRCNESGRCITCLV